MRMNVDQLVLEMATPRAGEIEVFKEYRNEKEIGLGVANPRTDTIEKPAEIVQPGQGSAEVLRSRQDFPESGLRLRHLRRALR